MSQSLHFKIELLNPGLKRAHRSLSRLMLGSVAVASKRACSGTGKIGDAARALSDASILQGLVFFLRKAKTYDPTSAFEHGHKCSCRFSVRPENAAQRLKKF